MGNFTVGIDLGTTTTLAFCMQNEEPELIRMGNYKYLDSLLYVDKKRNIIVGKRAKNRINTDVKNCIRSSKTKMGQQAKIWKCNGLEFSPTDVAVEILKTVKTNIVKTLGVSNDTKIDAIITVPAYFNTKQYEETKKAGQLAGFNVLDTIPEPMAAAVAAAASGQKMFRDKEKILVVDIGGGTFDLCLMQISEDGVYKSLSTSGDPKLGGDDFNDRMYNYLKSKIENELEIDLTSFVSSGLEDEDEYNEAIGKLISDSEEKKEDICRASNGEIEIYLDDIFPSNNTPLEFVLTIEEFDELCNDLYERIIVTIRKFIDDLIKKNKIRSTEDISDIILAGGTCYVPRIQKIISEYFCRPVNVSTGYDLTQLVAAGAAIIASSREGLSTIKTTLSHSLGVQARVYDKKYDVFRYEFVKILEKDAIYPNKKEHLFQTADDNQTSVRIRVYEAGCDCEEVKDIGYHDYYGELLLEGISPAPKGKKIKVIFNYDSSRCLTVTAIDVDTGKKQEAIIEKTDKPKSVNSDTVDFALLLDVSTSMSGKPLDEAKRACQFLINTMMDMSVHQMSLITFAKNAEKKCAMTSDRKVLLKAVDNIVIGRGITNMLAAFKEAVQELSSTDKVSKSQVVIVVTDGVPFEEKKVKELAGELKNKKGVRIIVIGVGDEVQEDTLEALASSKDNYKIDDMSVLQKTFQKVMDSIVNV